MCGCTTLASHYTKVTSSILDREGLYFLCQRSTIFLCVETAFPHLNERYLSIHSNAYGVLGSVQDSVADLAVQTMTRNVQATDLKKALLSYLSCSSAAHLLTSVLVANTSMAAP